MPHPLGHLRCDGTRDEDVPCEELTHEQVVVLVDAALEETVTSLYARIQSSEPIDGCVVGALLCVATRMSCCAGMTETECRAVFEMALEVAREEYPLEEEGQGRSAISASSRKLDS